MSEVRGQTVARRGFSIKAIFSVGWVQERRALGGFTEKKELGRKGWEIPKARGG